MNQSKYHNKGSKNNNAKFKKTMGIILGVLIIIAVILGCLRGCEGDQSATTPDNTGTGIVYDDGAVVGGWDEADIDKIVEGLNEKVDEGMINISMNTAPSFENGTAAGSLMIVNESINRYPQVVEITRNDTNELIYKSGAIPVGSKIESAKLAVDLDPGTYECTAMFHNVDPNTGNYLGCAGAIIHVTVLE